MLSVDCSFTRLRRKGVWKGRLQKRRTSLSKIRGIRLLRKLNSRLVKNAAWAKCVYGAPLHDVCASDFRAWRSSTARAMGFSRSGESPKIALNLAGDSLDPQLQDVINRCSFWRRFLRRFPNLKENFLHMLNVGGVCNRPAGSLFRVLESFSWRPHGSCLVHPWFGRLNWLQVSFKFLCFALTQAWQPHICDDLKSHRPGFNISAVDSAAMKASLSHLSPTQNGAVRLYVHGGHFTSDIVCKWGTARSSKCPN